MRQQDIIQQSEHCNSCLCGVAASNSLLSSTHLTVSCKRFIKRDLCTTSDGPRRYTWYTRGWLFAQHLDWDWVGGTHLKRTSWTE